MGQCADVENWLRWTNPFGEAGLLLAIVDMRDLKLLSGKPGGMQHHEASAICHEIRVRRRDGIEHEPAVVRPDDAGRVLKPLIGVRAHCPVLDGEASGFFLDPHRVDLRRVCSPVLITNQKGYAAKRLDAFERDITQLAILQLRGERAGCKFSAPRTDLFRSAEPDGAGRLSAFEYASHWTVPWRAFPTPGSNRTARRKLISTM